MTPLFSIVIPALNEEQTLPFLLTDLVKQKEKRFEVIIVDGQSEDATKKVCLEFAKKLRVQVITSDRRNVSYQRNLGAASAKGEYVFFIDADSRLDSSFLTQLRKNTQKYQHLLYIPIHVPQTSSYPDHTIANVINFLVEMSHLTDKPFTYGPCMVFQKDFFRFLGGFNDKIFVYEDHEIVQRAYKRGVKALLLPELQVKYSYRRYHREGRLDVLGKYLVATAHLLAKGEVKEKIFDYDMGGNAKVKESEKTFNKQVKKVADKFKAQIDLLISDQA